MISACIFLAILVLVLSFAIKKKSIKFETKFLFVSLFLGILMMLVITPISPPDEPHHYNSTLKVSNILLLRFNDIDSYEENYLDFTDFVGHYNVKSAYFRVIEDVFEVNSPSEKTEIPAPSSISYPIQYLPQAVGVSIANILNLNMIWLFYLGRFCNLLFFIACVYFAIKRVPKYKMVFASVALLPITLQQAASFSYDSFINGLALLLIAYILSLILEESEVKKKDLFVITISSLLLSPTKIIYIFILFLLVCIPKEKFNSVKEKYKKISIIFLLSFIGILIVQGISILNISQGSTETWHGGDNYSLMYVFTNPIETIMLFFNTFINMFKFYLTSTFGVWMSGLSLKLPIIFGVLNVIVLFLSTIETKDSRSFKNQEKLIFLLTITFVGLSLMGSMMIFWTPNTSDVIQGVQGRYFIPVLPLLFFLLEHNKLKTKNVIIDDILILNMIISLSSIIYILSFTLNN